MTESPNLGPNLEASQGATARASGAGIAWLGLLLAAIAFIASTWQWWQSDGTSVEELSAAADQRDQRIQKLEQTVNALQQEGRADSQGADSRIATLEQGFAAQRELVSSLQSFQAETAAWTRSMQTSIEGDQARIAGLESRFTALETRERDSASELDLAEIGYVLRLAQERLQLFGDSKNADRALALADEQVATYDSPLFIGLRREIAAARERLAGMDQPDLVAISTDLDEVQNGLAKLRFAGEGQEPQSESSEAPATEETGWWDRFKAAFSGLVTVRRDSEIEGAVPVLADQEAVRQSAWLQVDLARLAVMRRDQPAYAAALERCSTVVQRWFEPSDANTTALVQSLDRLRGMNIDPPLPDISAPWAALQAIRAGGLAAPSVPAPPVSEPAVSTPTAPAEETSAPAITSEPDPAPAEDAQ